ncbi:MAG: restriction endonuclease subunit S [Balneolaceae bacterium]|nr:restriction endonuclease subunit S [Balneolaceae bacterium]
MALYPIEGEVLTEYLFYFYQYYGDELAFKFCQGTKQQSYTASIVKILPINLPPTLEEQRTIAEALSDVDDLIAELDALIEKKQQVKKGAMQQLLSGKKRLPGFDGEWEEKNIEEISKVFTKQTGFDYTKNIKPHLKNVGGSNSYPFIQNKDFEGISVNLNTDYYIPIKVADTFPRLILDERCLLFSISGRVGNVGVYSSKDIAFLGSAIAISKFYNPELLDWVMWYLKSGEGQKKLLRNVKEGAHKNLTLGDIRKIEIPFPTLQEQKVITQILSDMDAEIQALESKRDKYQQIKQGMMQELLTGKTRLV